VSEAFAICKPGLVIVGVPGTARRLEVPDG
jgi:hypothetical protein